MLYNKREGNFGDKQHTQIRDKTEMDVNEINYEYKDLNKIIEKKSPLVDFPQ
jgi:hypothetical protein